MSWVVGLTHLIIGMMFDSNIQCWLGVTVGNKKMKGNEEERERDGGGRGNEEDRQEKEEERRKAGKIKVRECHLIPFSGTEGQTWQSSHSGALGFLTQSRPFVIFSTQDCLAPLSYLPIYMDNSSQLRKVVVTGMSMQRLETLVIIPGCTEQLLVFNLQYV